MSCKYQQLAGALALFFVGGKASAHGFGERIDLPIPFNLYVLSAVATVVISFVLIGILSAGNTRNTERQVRLLEYTFGRFIFRNPVPRIVLRLLTLILTIVIIMAGFVGSPIPSYNIAPTFVWILFAVGMVYVSSFLGNLWPVMHPAATTYDLLSRVFKKEQSSKQWSSAIGFWPAVILYFAFRWIENVHPTPSDPSTIAILVIIYLSVSFIGMLAVGKESWLRYCDPFNVFFNFLSYCAVVTKETVGESAQYFLRLPGAGLLSLEKIPLAGIVFEMLMLSTIAFDGMKETPTWKVIRTSLGDNIPLSVTDTAGMILFLLLFLITYFCFAWLMSVVTKKEVPVLALASTFALSMLPIAVAYELAHFVSLFVLDGQRAIYLLSDPLGYGWNLFGTSRYEIRYGIINFKVLWNMQVLFIVLGHIISVYVAHRRALHLFTDRKAAIRSQYPMLVLMVCYTMFSLWILAQPIIGG